MSPFGIGSSSQNNKDLTTWIPQMSEIGIRNMRACRTGWGAVQPQEGIFSWETLDAQLDFLEQNKIETGGLLLGTAGQWNKKDDPKGLPLNSLPEWTNYVKQIVAHTKGRIKRWEVWNEPPNGTRNAPPSDYAKVVTASYNAAKEANPDCFVGISAKSAHINYLDQVISGGAKDHFDFVTLHPYELLGCVIEHPGTEPMFMNIVPALRKMLKAQNPEKENVPVIFTELGFDSRKGEEKQAQALIKAYTMSLAQGVECVQWFEGKDGDSGPLGLLRGNGTPRPAHDAMARMIATLGEDPKYLGWVRLGTRDYGFVFDAPAGPTLVLWGTSKIPQKVDFGAEVEITDPITGETRASSSYELGVSPIFVKGIPATFVATANGNKGKPIPWGGDFSNAESVSVTMGDTNIEKGLHTQSAESIAKDVVTYGGSARAGNIPGGNVFMVDPSFLTYDRVPIEISVVARRNEANDPASITLEYETTGVKDGYKKLPPFEIPDNENWHTATWKIDDAQFVGTWAFHFRINSGKYAIQNVTVKKLEKTGSPREP